MVEVLTQNKDALVTALEILDDLLSFEKLDAQKMVLECTLQNPFEFLTFSMAMFFTQAASKGVKLIPPSAPVPGSALANCVVCIDKFKMSQVIRNFLSNAIKFTKSGDTICVRISLVDEVNNVSSSSSSSFSSKSVVNFLRGSAKNFSLASITPQVTWLRIEVEDTGVGIAASNLPRLFREIVQFDANKLQQGKGSGLGMFISREIVELHRGRVSVKSEGLGRGSLFIVDLPLANADHLICDNNANDIGDIGDLALSHMENGLEKRIESNSKEMFNMKAVVFSSANSTSHAENGWIDQSNENQLEDHFHESHQHNHLHVHPDVPDVKISSPPVLLIDAVAKDLTGKRILVVDDSPVNLKMVAMLLSNRGAKCVEAVNGAVAVEIIKSSVTASDKKNCFDEKFDAVIMDNLMPVLCGPDACLSMREIGFSGLIIGLSGLVSSEDSSVFLSSGASVVMSKPVNVHELMSCLLKT